MKSFSREYVKMCNAYIGEYGFRRCRIEPSLASASITFGRIINDVFQTFYLERVRGCHEKKAARIGFDVFPLCQRIQAEEAASGMGLLYLRGFEPSDDLFLDRFLYHSDDESIDGTIQEIKRFFNTYMIPFFEHSLDCISAKKQSFNVRRQLEDARLETLKRNGINNSAPKDAWKPYFSQNVFYMALKTHDYELAAEMRKWDISYFGEKTDNAIGNDLQVRQKRILDLKQELVYLEDNFYAFFDEKIKENEAYSIEQLSWFFN